MVPAAEQEEVLSGRGTTIGPMHDVMGIAPGMRPITPREPTMSIPNDHRSAHRGWDDLGAPADVQWFGASIHHDPHHRAVARQTSSDLRRHRTDVVELARGSRGVLQRLGTDRHRDVRSLSCHGGSIGQVQPPPADLTERIDPTLRGGSVIVVATRAGLGVAHGSEGRQ